MMGGMPVPEAQEVARIVNHLLLKNSVLGDCRAGFFLGFFASCACTSWLFQNNRLFLNGLCD